MTLSSLTDLARINVCKTYLELGRQMPGTEIEETLWFHAAMSTTPYAFCNFVIGMDADEENWPNAMESIRVRLERRPSMRVFALSQDRPEGWWASLPMLQLTPSHHLVQMAWEGAPVGAAVPLGEHGQLCTQAAERESVAEFMVNQFFGMSETLFRRAVRGATLQSDHMLFRWSEHGETIGAAMLSSTEGCLGLYNLCVLPRARRCGWGSEMVRTLQLFAFDRGLPLIMQCDPSLKAWYSVLGFEEIGAMTGFSLRKWQ